MDHLCPYPLRLFFLYLYISQDSTCVHCATLTASDQTGQLGSTFNLNSSYTLEAGESPSRLYLRKRMLHQSFKPVCYKDFTNGQIVLQDKSQRCLMRIVGNTASFSIRGMSCKHGATYLWSLSYIKVGESTKRSSVAEQNLMVEAKPGAPTILPGYSPNGKTYVEGQELEIRCGQDVGLPAGNYMWFGYRQGQIPVNFTSMANPGHIFYGRYGPRDCVIRRESTLKLTLTRDDNNITIRCVVNQELLGQTPTPNEACNEFTCIQTEPIDVKYPIRQRDIEISLLPSLSEHIIGSTVTMQCTVDGNPLPNYRWERDESGTIVTLEGQNSWTLTNLTFSDGGMYRCYARNNVSDVVYKASTYIYINVVEHYTNLTSSTFTSVEHYTNLTSSTFTSDDSTVAVVLGVGISLLVLVIICVIIVVIFRRKLFSRCSGTNDSPTQQTRVKSPAHYESVEIMSNDDLGASRLHSYKNVGKKR